MTASVRHRVSHAVTTAPRPNPVHVTSVPWPPPIAIPSSARCPTLSVSTQSVLPPGGGASRNWSSPQAHERSAPLATFVPMEEARVLPHPEHRVWGMNCPPYASPLAPMANRTYAAGGGDAVTLFHPSGRAGVPTGFAVRTLESIQGAGLWSAPDGRYLRGLIRDRNAAVPLGGRACLKARCV